VALSLGLVVVVVGQGFSTIGAVRVVEDVALGVAIAELHGRERRATLSEAERAACAADVSAADIQRS